MTVRTFALVDVDGRPTAFFTTDVTPLEQLQLNAALVEITTEAHATLLSDRTKGIVNGALATLPELPPTSEVLSAYLADKRYRVETGGIVIPGDPPMPCWTDRATQSMLGRVLDSLDRGFVTAPLNIKTPAGAFAMSAEQISGIAALVAQHVQQCFDIEASLSSDIALGNITTAAEIDAAAWPSNT